MDFNHWSLIVLIGEWSIRIIFLPVIIMRKERPAACLAWLAVVYFQPWVGLPVYLLFGEARLGRRKLLRRLRRIQGTNPACVAQLHDHYVPDPLMGRDQRILTRLAEGLGGLPVVDGNSIAFISSSSAMIDQLVEQIDAAAHHVHLLYFIFRDDSVGRRVTDSLVRAAERGVACRVLADAVGSRQMFRRLAGRMRDGGVQVHPVLPVHPIRRGLARIDLRNHRKLAVIDGRVAFVGSQNIVEEGYGKRGYGPWRDVTARLTGPVVAQLQGIFLEDWFYETNTWLEDSSLFDHGGSDGSVAVQVVPTGPDQPTEQFQDLIVETVHLAQRRVTMTSPYFVPDEGMLQALRLAAARGVRVELVLPRRGDHPIANAAGRFYCEHLLRHGANVYQYSDGLLHTKSMTIDDKLAMFGSANFDIRSFRLNFELNLLLHDASAVAQLHAIQQAYIRASHQVSLENYPGHNLPGRLVGNLAKLLSPLL